MKLDLPCSDGTDPDCHGTVEVDLPGDPTAEEVEAALEEEVVCAACGRDDQGENANEDD